MFFSRRLIMIFGLAAAVLLIAVIYFTISSRSHGVILNISLGDEYFNVVSVLGQRSKDMRPNWQELVTITEKSKVTILDTMGDIEIAKTQFLAMSFDGGQMTNLEVCLSSEYESNDETQEKYNLARSLLLKRGWVAEVNRDKSYSLQSWLDESNNRGRTDKYVERWSRNLQVAQIIIKYTNDSYLVNLSFYDQDLVEKIDKIRKDLGFDDGSAFQSVPEARLTFSKVNSLLHK